MKRQVHLTMKVNILLWFQQAGDGDLFWYNKVSG